MKLSSVLGGPHLTYVYEACAQSAHETVLPSASCISTHLSPDTSCVCMCVCDFSVQMSVTMICKCQSITQL